MIHTLYRKKWSSLLDLVRFVDDEQNEDLIELGTQTNNYVIRDYFTHKFIDPKMSVTKHGLANRINNFLAAQTLQRLVTGKTTIDLKKEINSKSFIVFDLSKWKLGSKVSKIYGRFVFTILLNLMLARADMPAHLRVPLHIYIDEFHNYVSDALPETFAEGRKYRMYLTVATQVIGQGMSTEMQKSILGNSNVKIIGKAGYESRDMMIKQMSFDEKSNGRSYGLIPPIFTMFKRRLTKRSFAKLKVGRFISQVDIYNSRKFRNWKILLGNKHSMKEWQWKAILKEQLDKYYAPPFNFGKLVAPHPSNYNNPFAKNWNDNNQWKKRREDWNSELWIWKKIRKFRTNLTE